MFNADDFRELCEVKPFRPFTIHLTNGSGWRVLEPDVDNVGERFVMLRDVNRTVWIAYEHIERIEIAD